MILEVFIFLFGMAVGSFVNVCIHRLPQSISVIRPRSMCPSCQAKIAFYDNIPVASYLWLRGRCRHCGTAISLRYPMVELVSGLFAVAMFARYGLTWEGFFLYGLVAALLVITFIDIDHQIIPDVITCPGIGVGFLLAFVLGHITYKDSLFGIILGGGFLFLIALSYYLLTKREGMGGGDIKLLAMIGAFLGWKAVIFSIFVGSAVGTLAGGVLAIRGTEEGRRLAIPFGPFLSLGALLFLFFGPEIIGWYLQILR